MQQNEVDHTIDVVIKQPNKDDQCSLILYQKLISEVNTNCTGFLQSEPKCFPPTPKQIYVHGSDTRSELIISLQLAKHA